MTAKDYLGKIRTLEAHVEAKMGLIDSLRATLTNTCSHLSDSPRSASPDLQPTQTLIARICDIEQEANAAVDAFVDYQQAVVEQFEQLSKPLYRQVLEMRYIKKMRWEEICYNLKYSRRGVDGIHSRAMIELEDKLNQ